MPDLSKRAERPAGPERRSYPARLEVRSQSDGAATIEGYASVVEAGYEMWDPFGTYTEVVRSGSFSKTLSENPQVQLLLNHGGLSMAYTRAGSLRLSEDSTGLHIGADLNTTRTDVRDMVTALRDGAVDEMSFAFQVTRQQWSPDFTQRDIQEVSLNRGDVSVVNFGANPGTSVAMRAQDFFGHMDDDAARDLLGRLQSRFTPIPAPGIPADLAAAQVALLRLGARS